MKVDPLPLEPRTGPSFGYGYDGGSPYALYQALIRCVFGTPEAPFTLNQVKEARSALWHSIATTQGPLRLPWPTVRQWARADAAEAGYTGTPDPPRPLPAVPAAADRPLSPVRLR
jgi:hypothetical protein